MSSRVQMYRKRLKKENPEKYKEYLEKQRVRVKIRRDQLKAELSKRKPSVAATEKRERENELARIRQTRYLQRKKERAEKGEHLIVKISGGKPLTRKQKEEQKLRWRQAKQKYRSKLTQQKKTWIKRKDRERKLQKREQELAKHRPIEETISRKTEWNWTAKARKNLPSNPANFAAVLQNLATKSSLLKRKAVEEILSQRPLKFTKLGLGSSRQGRTALKVIATKLLKKAADSARSISRRTGLTRNTLSKLRKQGLNKKPRQPRISPNLVQNFYKREDISRTLPQKRFAMKCGPGYLLQVPLKAAYSQFKEEHPNQVISFAKFAALRPKNVRLLNNTHREFCLCVYCQNVRYKLLVLSRLSTSRNSCRITNESQISQLLLCPKSDSCRFHKPECINATCPVCKDQANTLRNHFSYVLSRPEVCWNHWERIADPTTGKKRRILRTKTGSGKEVVEELIEDVVNPCQGTSFIQHIFTARWQSMQYTFAKQELKENSVISVMDFAKNRTIQYQDEIKSAFFGATQITIHPIVTYYKTSDRVVRDSLVFLSEDINHDYHAVNKYLTVAQDHVENKLGTTPVHNIIFSDGCGAQYKSRGPFGDLSIKTNKLNRNYFGSEHGKSEGDGETGVVNRAIDRAILGRRVIINNVEDMFKFCSENLTMEDPLTQRHFFLIKPEEIERNRPFTEVKLLPGTRKVHQILNVPGKPYSVVYRSLSCFCPACLDGKGVCINKPYVTAFKEKKLQRSPVVIEDTPHIGFPENIVDQAIQVLVDGADLDLATDHPDLAADHPDLAADHPDLPADHPDLASDHPDLPADHPDLAADHPDLPADHPDLPADNPDLARAVHELTDPSSSDACSQIRNIKPSDFIYVKCPTEKKRTFHYVAQVVGVGPGSLTIRYLFQPYKGQPAVWAWRDGFDYDVDMSSVTRVLEEPELISHQRSGDVYFKFHELEHEL